jgi:hypothetical protein
MATEWRMVRIPVELAEETNRAHTAGRLKLANEYVTGVPLHVTIKMAADCLEAHRRRGRRPRKGGGHTDEDGDVRLDLTVYTPSTNK